MRRLGTARPARRRRSSTDQHGSHPCCCAPRRGPIAPTTISAPAHAPTLTARALAGPDQGSAGTGVDAAIAAAMAAFKARAQLLNRCTGRRAAAAVEAHVADLEGQAEGLRRQLAAGECAPSAAAGTGPGGRGVQSCAVGPRNRAGGRAGRAWLPCLPPCLPEHRCGPGSARQQCGGDRLAEVPAALASGLQA
jgi:hypothetical protein